MVLTIIIGVATGLAASALFWWLQAKLLRPRIVICPSLRLVEGEEGASRTRPTWEFTVINRGRFAAADISLKVNFSVPGLLSAGNVFNFYMRDLSVSWMEPGTDDQYVIGPKHLLQDDEQKEYCTKLEKMLGRSLRQLDMLELLEACAGSYVTVFVASNHAFSGARSFTRGVFAEKDFIMANNECGREACCNAEQGSWSSVSGLVTRLSQGLMQVAHQSRTDAGRTSAFSDPSKSAR